MRAMPKRLAFITAAPTARGGIFSCCRIGSRPVELQRIRNQRKALELRSPVKDTGHRVAARAKNRRFKGPASNMPTGASRASLLCKLSLAVPSRGPQASWKYSRTALGRVRPKVRCHQESKNQK
jgi:hypothetical protein